MVYRCSKFNAYCLRERASGSNLGSLDLESVTLPHHPPPNVRGIMFSPFLTTPCCRESAAGPGVRPLRRAVSARRGHPGHHPSPLPPGPPVRPAAAAGLHPAPFTPAPGGSEGGGGSPGWIPAEGAAVQEPAALGEPRLAGAGAEPQL